MVVTKQECVKSLVSGVESHLHVQVNICLAGVEWIINEDIISAGIECNVLKNPINGHVTVGKRIVGSIALYSCAVGFVLDGEDRRVCQSDGQWSGEEPFCDSLEGLLSILLT